MFSPSFIRSVKKLSMKPDNRIRAGQCNTIETDSKMAVFHHREAYENFIRADNATPVSVTPSSVPPTRFPFQMVIGVEQYCIQNQVSKAAHSSSTCRFCKVSSSSGDSHTAAVQHVLKCTHVNVMAALGGCATEFDAERQCNQVSLHTRVKQTRKIFNSGLCSYDSRLSVQILWLYLDIRITN